MENHRSQRRKSRSEKTTADSDLQGGIRYKILYLILPAKKTFNIYPKPRKNNIYLVVNLLVEIGSDIIDLYVS